MREVGVADLRRLGRTDNFGRAVLALRTTVRLFVAVHLNKHCEVYVRAEHVFDRIGIDLVAVCGQLHAMRQSRIQVSKESLSGLCATRANHPRSEEHTSELQSRF